MLIAFGSLKASPGVTTTAQAVAAMWPASGFGQPVLLEADPAGGDVAARFGLSPAPGLVSLSAAARREHDVGLLAEHAVGLPGGLPVVAAPPAEEAARAAVRLLGRDGLPLLRAAATDPELVLVADVGRLQADSLAWPVIEAADVLLLVVRPVLSELSRVISAAEQLGERLGAAGTRMGLITVGDGPFPAEEITEATGIAVTARLPEDTAAAAMLAGRPDPRGAVSRMAGRGGIAKLPLARAAAALAAQLAAELFPEDIDHAGITDDVALGDADAEPIGASA